MKSYEYFRGVYHGYAAAMELRLKYSTAFIVDNARQLEAHLRKRNENHTDFDRGYSHAFSTVAAKWTLEACDRAPFEK